MTRDQAMDLLPCLVCGDLPAAAEVTLRAMIQEDAELREMVLALEESQELCHERLERRAPSAALWPKEMEEQGQGKARSWVKTLAIASFVLLVLMWGGATLLQALL
ncbi:MAG: hypothetical protein ACI9VR_001550 [Cognaticolwellia sp.]|jgi:hypothetical protein